MGTNDESKMKNEEEKSGGEAVRIGQRYFQRKGKLNFYLFLNQFPTSTQHLGWVEVGWRIGCWQGTSKKYFQKGTNALIKSNNKIEGIGRGKIPLFCTIKKANN